MFPFLFPLLASLTITSAHATPRALSLLRARNDTNSNPPTINVSIKSPNGTDLTSITKTMIYLEPKIADTSDLNSRFLTPGLSRPQNNCQSRTGDASPGRFAYSHCAPDGGVTGSLQSFIIYCYPPRVKDAPDSTASSSDSDSSDGRRPSKMPFGTAGMCAPHEICADGRGVGSHYDRKKVRPNADAQVAHCVSQEYYVELAVAGAGAGHAALQLDGERASMVFSSADAKTPLEVKEMDLVAGVTGEVNADGTAKVQGSCKDCVDLFSGKFEKGTDFLRTQATVLSAVGGAVLWIAIMSG